MSTGGGELVLFGAGNIGRSFIAEVFASAGWRVTFVDVDRQLIDALERRGGYEVVIVDHDKPERVVPVRGVRAIDATDGEAVAAAVARADCLATAVGAGVLPRLAPAIANGLSRRCRPLDIILAENHHDAPALLGAALRQCLGDGRPLPGLVASSIGKMVPPPTSEERAADPLRVRAESYRSLIVDADAFTGPPPAIEALRAVSPMQAWMQRKLFIHNLGHASLAYLGHRAHPQARLLVTVLDDPLVREGARRAMEQAAQALLMAWPGCFTEEDLSDHIDDLMRRFANRALGDTVFRVGRDLARKLLPGDRLLGAMALCRSQGCPFDAIVAVYRAALAFRPVADDGHQDAADVACLDAIADAGLPAWLEGVAGFDDEAVIDAICGRVRVLQ